MIEERKVWHVAELKPFYSSCADRFLEQWRDRIGAQWELFYPRIREERKWSRGRTKVVTRSYIGSYLFVRFDPYDGCWPMINDAIGVSSIMYSVGDKPAVISDLVINDLISRCVVEYGEDDTDMRCPRYFIDEESADEYIFKIGASVKITEGIYSDHTGVVDSATRRKVIILGEMFGREIKMTVKSKHVELV